MITRRPALHSLDALPDSGTKQREPPSMYYHPKPAANHAAALRPGQLRHVIRVASVTGRQAIRDVMLLWLTHSTGVHVTELASIETAPIRPDARGGLSAGRYHEAQPTPHHLDNRRR